MANNNKVFASEDIKFQIFVSSPYSEARVREVVFKAIQPTGHIAMLMESLPPSTKQTAAAIKSAMDSSQIYVLILGYIYGSKMENSQDGDSDEISYTEYEYNHAVDSRKNMLVFLQDEEEIKKSRSTLDQKSDEAKNTERLWKFYDKVKLSDSIFHSEWSKKDLEGLSANVVAAIMKQAEILSHQEYPNGWIRATRARDRAIIDRSIENELRLDIVERFNQFTKLDARCFEAKEQKKALAVMFHELLVSNIVEEEIDFFLDSGSTVAYIAKELGYALRQHISMDEEGNPNIFIATNNSLAYLHLWLRNQVPCNLFPSGSPEGSYGAVYGPISKYGKDPRPPRAPDYNRRCLSKSEKKRIDRLSRAPIQPKSHADEGRKFLIIGAISGMQINDDYKFIPPISEPHIKRALCNCKGFHVGDYYNMLFKRYLYYTKHPAVVCIHYKKVNLPIQVGSCHFVFDNEFNWNSFIKEYPLAFCVGIDREDVSDDDAMATFNNLGFDIICPRESGQRHVAFFASNKKFQEHIKIE